MLALIVDIFQCTFRPMYMYKLIHLGGKGLNTGDRPPIRKAHGMAVTKVALGGGFHQLAAALIPP